MIIFLRILRSSLTSFRRNGWLSLISIFTMSQALLILSIFFVMGIAVGSIVQGINSKLDLAIYFKDNATEEEIHSFQSEIQIMPEVTQVTYVSKSDALNRYLEQNQGNQQLVQVIGNDADFFPASLEIKVKNPSIIGAMVSQFNGGPHASIIKSTSYTNNQEVAKKLQAAVTVLSRGGMLLGIIFLVIALLIIFNTIRIAIFTRREEIEIMKLVGATDWYIRWPFIIEGILYGVFAAILSTLLIYLGYFFFVQGFFVQYLFSDLGTLAKHLLSHLVFLQLFGIQILVGLVVGAVSSFWATKRYLQI
jgi:cell division transport system permease protein